MAKNSKEYALAIKIAGEIEKSFTNSTRLTKKELQDIAKHAADVSSGIGDSFYKSFNQMDKGFNAVSKAASKTFDLIMDAAEYAAVSMAALTAASAAVGISFESAFAGVKKTTEATNAEYAMLKEEILDMANSIPATADTISAVAETAGQLGIQKENLLDFTRVMIDLGESTNLTATEGASDLAKFANITQMAADKYSNLGSVIVALGNNFATTESDIVSMATRLASSGELIGLTEAQIMAVAATLSSLGIEAEAGGSSMSKLLKMMQVSVETNDGLLKDFASVAGMTTKQFKAAFQEDAVAALAAFASGLNDTKRNGKSAIAILDDMELKEIRLSNTILSLANGSGLLTQAVSMANKAWEENSALAEEAGKRYETNESKLKIFRNNITGLGILLYDEYSEPLGEAIDVGTKYVQSLSKDVIPYMIDKFKEELPTVIRKIKEYGGAFIEFGKPILSLGNWLVEHPDVISSFLVGIGSAMVTYKLVSVIKDITKAFAGLGLVLTNPFALAITGVALAIGGAAGIAAYISHANKVIKKQSLAEHFGNISLSLEDLQDIATKIIRTNNIGKLSEVMSALGDLDGISRSIESAIKTINEKNWKVGIGIKLSEDDQEEYKAAIEQFIENSKSLISQNQYAISLALKLFTNDDASGQAIRDQVNQFYSNTYQEVSELGSKLQEAVNNAFEDGLLDVDEAAVIADYMSQMSNITQKIADAEFTANLEVLKMRFSGAELTPDAYQNLQTEINSQVANAIADYEESLKYTLSNYQLMLGEGEIDQSTYDKWYNQALQNYLEQVQELQLKAHEYGYNTLMDAYGEELSTALVEIQKLISENMSTAGNLYGKDLDDFYRKLSKQARDLLGDDAGAISELFKLLEPSQESLKELAAKYMEAGKIIPEALDQAILDSAMIGALTGNIEQLRTIMSNALADEKGIRTMTQTFFNTFKSDLKNVIENSSYDFKINKVKVSLNSRLNAMGLTLDNLKIPGYASGGIITSPTIASFAENVPEAAIPLDGSKKSIDLWRTTGTLLGVYTKHSDGGDTFERLLNQSDNSIFSALLDKIDRGKSEQRITYSPNYNFYGAAPTKEDMVSAARISKEEFSAMMEEWEYEHGRSSFRR